MPQNTAHKLISKTLYSLKRAFPGRVVIHRRLTETVDLETGEKTITKQSWAINRAIILPSNIHREFVYDLTFIATNKNFTYGGHFDTSERRILIDRKDLASNFELLRDDYIVYDGRRYEVKEIAEFEYRLGYAVVMKHLVGADTDLLENANMISEIILTSEATGTL